jgi:hypothetical protein
MEHSFFANFGQAVLLVFVLSFPHQTSRSNRSLTHSGSRQVRDDNLQSSFVDHRIYPEMDAIEWLSQAVLAPLLFHATTQRRRVATQWLADGAVMLWGIIIQETSIDVDRIGHGFPRK